TVTIARHRFWICVTGSGCAMSSVSPKTLVWRRISCLWRRQPRRDTAAIPARSCVVSKPSPMRPGPGQNPPGDCPGRGQPKGRDTRYIVTNPEGGRGKHLYEKIYCARGQAENHIRAWKAHLASDRTSCSKANAN